MPNLACILAAGQGTRLGPLPYPKGFLRLGELPIVAESLERLRSVGITEVVVVTGHLASFYQELEGVRLVHNADYASTGSLQSLAAAREHLTGDFLLLESDLIYERRALEVLLQLSHPDAVLLSGPTGAGDEVWVEARDGWLVSMSKDRSRLSNVTGELVGISRVSQNLYSKLLCQPGQHYESHGMVGCAPTHPIACPLVQDLLWAEIDDARQLARARALHPRLC
jgi:2-aminoethylphosphonate-pyruvate transaminase